MKSLSMNTALATFPVLAGILGAVAAVQPEWGCAQTPGWTVDMEAAMRQAAAEKKDLVLNFTGSDWCGYCKKMRRDVFARESFQTVVKEHFVLVHLDFPNDRSKLTRETQQQNESWQKKLKVKGFPTIVLIDSNGMPYAQTGFKQGAGPREYADHLDELRTVRTRRDELFARADSVEGIERAEMIDQAIRVVLQTVDVQAVFSTYVSRVEEIIRLDAQDTAGLRNKYEQTLAAVVVRHLEDQLYQVVEQQGADAALERIEKIRVRFQPRGNLAMNLGILEAHVFAWEDRYDDALVVFDDFLESAEDDSAKGTIYAIKASFFSHFKKNDVAIEAADAALSLVSDQKTKRQMEKLKRSLANQVDRRRQGQ